MAPNITRCDPFAAACTTPDDCSQPACSKAPQVLHAPPTTSPAPEAQTAPPGPGSDASLVMKVYIYKDSSAFLAEICSVQLLRSIDYANCATITDCVSGLALSAKSRKELSKWAFDLGVLSNDERWQDALHSDAQRILEHVVTVIQSPEALEAALKLEDENAQHFIDVINNTLRGDLPMTPEDRSRAAQMIHKIYEAWDGFPSEIFIEGVTYRDRDPSFGGGYADVYRARYKDKPVALKRLRVFIQGEEPRAIRSKFRREVLVWQRLKHPYILPLIGIFREETSWSSLFMVSPWMDRGNILGHLRDIGMNDVNRRLYEIAQGIQYLHSQGVVHGDLRGQNIVVTENWNACLIDFGLSRYSEASRRSSKDGGSTRWMAPELIDPEHFEVEFLATYASDVYAFGCVCMELYTLQPPFIKIPLEASDYAILLRVIEGERPERPTEEPLMTDSFWNCVTTYWGQDRATRPSAADIVLDMASFCSVGVGHRKNSAVPLIQPGTSDSPFWFSIDDTSDTDDFLPLSLDHADIISLSPDGTIVQPRTGVQRACSRGCVYPY